MKFKLLNAALYPFIYDDKEIDKICTQIKGTVYENRISIVPKFVEWLKTTEREVFVDINSLEELKELSEIFFSELVIRFSGESYIVIYDGYLE